MATERKNDAPSMEKVGTSSSSIPTKTKKSYTTTNQTPSQKQVPNYLKPTISSSGLVDHPHPPPKKQGISHTKPNSNRRSSLDKPLSLTSSSSFTSNKSQHTSLRSTSPALSKVHSLPKHYAKKTIQPSSSAKGTKITKTRISSTDEKETSGKEGEHVPTEIDSFKKEAESIPVNDIVKEEVKLTEVNNDQLITSENQNVEDPSICEDVEACNLDGKSKGVVDVEIERVVEKEVVEEVVSDNLDQSKAEKNEIENEVAKESDEKEQEQEQEQEREKEKEVEKEKEKEKEEEEEEKEEETKNENSKENVLGANENELKIEEPSETESKEEELEKGKEEEGKDMDAEEVKNKGENTSGKKEAQQYNDVIEETKNKLLEKRKNKVKALVGAFETVISLQEPEP